MQIPSENLKDRWLEAALPLVAQEGWTRDVLARAAQAAGLSAGEQALAAPGGVNDLIDHLFERAARQMQEMMAERDLSALRVHEKVAAGLRLWLDALEPHRDSVRKAAGRGLLPWGAGAATRRVWAVADAVWLAAGDTASDYNRQTKRGLLSAVIPGIVLRWLAGLSGERLDAHIARRLRQAMQVGQLGSRAVKPLLDVMARR